MQTIIFEVTTECNHNCRYCYNIWRAPGANHSYSDLNTAETLFLLNKAINESGVGHITVSGGEPLLRQDLSQILAMLTENGIRSTIITNGRLLTKSRALSLIDSGAGLFELTLLSYRHQIHDYLAGSAGAFHSVLAAMAVLRKLRIRFAVSFVATRLNIADIRDTIRLAFAFGASGFMLNRFNPGGRGLENLRELFPMRDQIASALEIADTISAELGFPISCSIPIQPCLIGDVWESYNSMYDERPFPNLQFGFCGAGSNREYLTLDSTGNLRPCNHSSTIIGNLFHSSFAELIRSESLAIFNRAIPRFCRDCSVGDTCQGGCKAAAQACYGSPETEEPFLMNNLESYSEISAR